jgi:quercetin dioxygenase-like cupin family protein
LSDSWCGDSKNMNTRRLCAIALLLAAISFPASAQSDKQGTTYRSPGGATLKLMLDDSNVGPEVTVGELTFPANADSGDHTHGAIEMFYVLSGELEHIVNGKSQILKPGMVGYVKPPDKIRHKTGPAGAKVVVIWVPGDEGKKIAARWTKEP